MLTVVKQKIGQLPLIWAEGGRSECLEKSGFFRKKEMDIHT
jgi:endonuclease I